MLATTVSDGLASQGHPRLHPSRWLAMPFVATGHATAARLARWTNVTRQSANSLLRELREQGYVEERPEPGNRRSMPIVLTAKGQATMSDADQIAANVLRSWAHSHACGEADLAFETLHQLVVMERMDAKTRW